MAAAPGSGDVERFRDIVARHFGFEFDNNRLASLTELLRQRLLVHRCSSEQYLAKLESRTLDGELRNLAQDVTVGETYFFRNGDQLRAFREVALQERLRERGAGTRILSAACASGEEAYTLAIMLLEARAPRNVTVCGIDINPVAIEKARQALYTDWALRETPAELRQQWFHRRGSHWELNDEVRTVARFEERNLLNEDAAFWQPGSYDIVFCRNVLMYFKQDHARDVVARIARAMVPGGYLFLGHAETLRGLSHDFHLCHTHDTFYYQRKDVLGVSAPDAIARAAAPLQAPAPVIADIVAGADTWVDAIGKAAARIQTLTTGTRPAAASSGARSRAPDLGHALDLLQRERYAEALAAVQTLPSDAADDPDVLLLRAALLTHTGALAPAEDVCRRLLKIDELNAGAHYLLALCREGVGDRAAAVEYDKVAIYLDPAFAMPHLHLGLQARRAGDRELARRELTQAELLLQGEDASRLLLFGGGFNRETLLALCRAELLGCGGRA